MTTSAGSFTSLFAPHSYAGAHGAHVIVGTGGDSVTVTVELSGGESVSEEIDASDRRTTALLDCPR